jgi:hypothetical protein
MSRGHVSGNLQAGVQPLQAFPSGQSLTGYAEHVYEQPEGEPPVETNSIRYWRDWAGLRNGQLELRLNNQRAPRVHGLGWGLDPDAGVWRPLRVDATGALVVSGAGPTPLEPPLAQIGAWYRADDISQASGSTVFTWSDRSGNGVDLVPVPAVSQPTLSTNNPQFNNRKAVDFSGTQQLYRLNPPNWPTGAHAFTIYVVNDPTLSGTLHGMFGWGVDLVTNARACFCYYGPAPHELGVDGYGNSTRKYFASAAAQISSASSANNANMSDATILVDGAVGTLAAAGNAVQWAIPNPCPEVRLGGFAGAPYGFFVGKIAEILVYHKNHNAIERSQTLAYLSDRYGIPVV